MPHFIAETICYVKYLSCYCRTVYCAPNQQLTKNELTEKKSLHHTHATPIQSLTMASTTTAANKASIGVLTKLGEELHKEAIDKTDSTPSIERCEELIDAIAEEANKKQAKSMIVTILQTTRIGNTVGKAIKCFKRHKRTEGEAWDKVLETSQGLVKTWKEAAKADEESSKKKKKAAVASSSNSAGPPKTVAEYRNRLVTHQKDLYKDPPVLPPMNIKIDPKQYAAPKRDKKTGQLSFVAPDDNDQVKDLLKDFHPNRSPEEVLRAGAFGGTYFRAIVSGVTNVKYNPTEVLKDTVDDEWIDGLDVKQTLTCPNYRNGANKFGVKCGGSLGMWESSGWITECDPYGWFQWYCRFYRGRRCDDDVRQISRWLKSAGPKGRFRSQLCNKILVANTTPDDRKISPVIRQTLLHWGLEITADVLEKHRKRVGK